MSLTLHIDEKEFDKSLIKSLESYENSIIPVIKGNGYGIGRENLAKKCKDLNISSIATGTIFEAKDLINSDLTEIIVMDPIKESDKEAFNKLKELSNKKIVLTISDVSDVSHIGNSPVIVEILTSMNRFGIPIYELNQLKNLNVKAFSLHLPIDKSGNEKLSEIDLIIKKLAELNFSCNEIHLSHISDSHFKELINKYPNYKFKNRLGTKFWLNNMKVFQIKSTVLEVHDIANQSFGYRQRKINAANLLIVSGGTAHGVGLQAPRSNTNLKSRITAIVSGILEAFDLNLSPFIVSGKQRFFAESPHMNVSMLKLPVSITPPKVGSEITASLRMTTTNFDEVIFN